MPFVRFNAKMSGTKSMCPTLAWLDFNIISQDLTPFFCLPTKAVGRKALPTLPGSCYILTKIVTIQTVNSDTY